MAVVRPLPVAATRQSAAILSAGLTREEDDGHALPFNLRQLRLQLAEANRQHGVNRIQTTTLYGWIL